MFCEDNVLATAMITSNLESGLYEKLQKHSKHPFFQSIHIQNDGADFQNVYHEIHLNLRFSDCATVSDRLTMECFS